MQKLSLQIAIEYASNFTFGLKFTDSATIGGITKEQVITLDYAKAVPLEIPYTSSDATRNLRTCFVNIPFYDKNAISPVFLNYFDFKPTHAWFYKIKTSADPPASMSKWVDGDFIEIHKISITPINWVDYGAHRTIEF